MSLTLVLGGTRSGKSAVAEHLTAKAAAGGAAVTYIATGAATDEAMAERIARHRARRPAAWSTVEVADAAELPAALGAAIGVVLLDSLGTWVAAHPDLDPDGAALAAALSARRGDTVVVSEEVGLSVHPPTPVGRRFVDALGEVNRAVSEAADRAVLVVAGRLLELGPALALAPTVDVDPRPAEGGA